MTAAAQSQARTHPHAPAGDFTVIPGRAVFDIHDEFDGKGNLVRRFGVEQLAYIAARCNERDRKGAWCPLTLGHTVPNQYDEQGNLIRAAREDEQPVAVGYARNFRVGPDPVTGRPCLLADFYVRKDRHAEAVTYPRVSVELWPGKWDIDPVALLRRTPREDIPQWTYGRVGGRDVLRYSREANMDPTATPPAPPGAPPAAPPDAGPDLEAYMKHCYSHPAAAAIYQKYSAAAAPPPAAGIPPLGNDPGQPPPPGPGAPGAYAAGPGVGGPTATFVPGVGPGPVRHARDVENDRLKAELARTKLQYAREADLRHLLAQGLQFDLNEELADVMEMTPERYQRHLHKMVQRYHRDAAALPTVPVTTARVEGGVLGGPTRDEMNKAKSLATRQGIGFDEALAQIRGVN